MSPASNAGKAVANVTKSAGGYPRRGPCAQGM